MVDSVPDFHELANVMHVLLEPHVSFRDDDGHAIYEFVCEALLSVE